MPGLLWLVPNPGSRSNPGARNAVDKDLLYSEDPASPGWCNADVGGPSPRQNCYCNYDGSAGPLCNTIVEAYCINQCSAHGSCHMGYCQVLGCHISILGGCNGVCLVTFT